MTRLWTTDGVEQPVYDTAGRAVWGGTPTAPVPPPGTRRGIAVDLWRTGRVTTNRTSGATYWSPHRVRAHATGIQLTYGGDFLPGGTMPLAASITVDGARHVLTWGGETETVLTGPERATSDPVDITVNPGQTIEVLTYCGERSDGRGHPGAPGGWYSTEILPGNQVADGNPSHRVQDHYDGYDGYRPVMPHAITGLTSPDARSWLLLGDSITESGSPARTNVGTVSTAAVTWAQRALHDSHPVANAAIWASEYAPSQTGIWATVPDLSDYTDVLVAWGYNDLDQAWAVPARDVAYVQDRAITAWGWTGAAGARVWQATVSPSTDSTDGWATIEGQTPRAALPYRLAFNEWLRDGAPLVDGTPAEVGNLGAVRAGEVGHPLAGIIDQAARVESELGSGIFRVDHGPLTADGGHPNAVGHELMSEALAAIQA